MKRSSLALGSRFVLPLVAALSVACTNTTEDSQEHASLVAPAVAPSSPALASTPPSTSAPTGPAASATTSPATAPAPTPVPPSPPLGVLPGSTFAKESVHPIRWSVPTDLGALDSTVTIVESTDAGATFHRVTEAPLDDLHQGEYFRWTVPAEGTRGRVAVEFHHTNERGELVVLRRLESFDIVFSPSQKKEYTWQKVANDAPFGARDGAGGIVHDGKMWLIGGWNPDRFPLGCANDVWSSVDGATWVEEKANTFTTAGSFPHPDWEGRHFAGYHSWNGKMWIVGGDPNQGYYQTDVWSSVDGRHWTRTDVHAVQPRLDADGAPYSFADQRPMEIPQFGLRTAHVTAIFGGNLLVMGGQRIEQFVDPAWPGAPGKAFDDVWSSSDGATFGRVPSKGKMWAPRGYVSEAVELDGRLWLVGGGLSEDPSAGRPRREYFNDVWSTADGASWEQAPNESPFSPRIWHNVKAFDGRLWVINGYDGDRAGQGRAADNLADVWYSANGKDWYEARPPSTFVPRHAGTAWVHGGGLFVGSGNAIAGEWYADVWKMTPAQ